MYAFINTYIYTYIITDIHTNTHTYVHTFVHTLHMYMSVCMNIYMHCACAFTEGCVCRCRECNKAICSSCVHMHGRQQLSHALTEITSVVREREILEERLAHIQETSVEQTRRITAEEEEIEREKQKLAAQFKAEEKRRQHELEQIQAAAEEEAHGRKADEERRMRALEEKSARLKANAEQEAERRKAEEDEILQQKQKLEEALARVQAHSFRSMLSPISPRTKDSLVQETIITQISYTGVAAATASSASAPVPRSAETEAPDLDRAAAGVTEAGVGGSASSQSIQKPVAQRLMDLMQLLEDGLINQEEFDTQRAAIISSV